MNERRGKLLKRWQRCVAGAVLLLAVGFLTGGICAQAATPYGQNGRLSIKNGKVVNKKGKPFVIKGVSTHGLSWYPEYVNKKAFKKMRDSWGVNTVRLAMYTADYNGYCAGGSKKELKKVIDKGVKYATELGMYVIIDWHILSDGNPLTYKSEAKKFFKEIARKYSGYGNVMYEICNEPNGSGGSWKNIKSYSNTIIKTIRSVNKKAIIIVGTPTWCQEVDKPQADPLKGYKNIAYSFHFYAGTHKESLRSRLESAVKSGLPVIVTEFGISDASGSGGVYEEEGNRWIRLLDKYSIGRVCWNLSNKNESSALLKSSCGKTSGWSSSDLSASGKWLVKTYAGIKSSAKSFPRTKTVEVVRGSKAGGAASDTEKDGAGETTQNAQESPAADASQDGVEESKSGTSSGTVKIAASVKRENSWISDGNHMVQYKLILENKGEEASSQWRATVKLKKSFTLSNGWCASITQKGKTLTIEPMDWNARLEEKGTTEIGFIVQSSSEQSVSSVKIEAQP